jgi:hypothetical protein
MTTRHLYKQNAQISLPYPYAFVEEREKRYGERRGKEERGREGGDRGREVKERKNNVRDEIKLVVII